MKIFQFSILTVLFCMSCAAQAAIDAKLLQGLNSDDPDTRIAAVTEIAALANDDSSKVLNALKSESLYTTTDGAVLIVDGDNAYNPATGKSSKLPDGSDAISINNRLRGAIDNALSGLKLFSADKSVRLAAATSLQTDASLEQLPLISKAYAKESDPEVKSLLQLVIATANLQSPGAAQRKAAVTSLVGSSNAKLKPLLQKMLDKNPNGSFIEADASIRTEVSATLKAIDSRLARTEFIGNLFYGVSLGSVLLLTALGLAITFGLMGIINMAHGELLMIGAYTTYVVQMLFRKFIPGALDAYLIVALPAAFIVAGAVGIF